MLGSLVPGFKGAGHPDKANRREERRRAREERRRRDEEYMAMADPGPAAPGAVPDAAGEGAVRGDPRIRRRHAPMEEAEMESIRSPRYRGDDPEHHHGVPGARGVWDSAERLGTIAPVMGNPSLDPAAGDLVAVSYMAGYGRDTPIGHDAMDGVDQLVLGKVDANRELEAPSATEGTPLQLAPHESAYSDDHLLGTHDTGLRGREGAGLGDWCAELRMHDAEPESGDRLDPEDWCSCL